MPDRILRAGLFSSEAWLALKNNDDRVCYIALFETADNLGNQPSGPFRLIRLWRPYGIETPEKVAKVLLELSEVDLVRPYQCDGKPYVNIPRFNQSTRYPGFLYALPPFATIEQKQVFTKKSRVNHGEAQRVSEDHGESHDGVGVGVGVGVGASSHSSKKKDKTIGAEVAAAPLPGWLPTTLWEAWVDHRKALRKPMTQHAASLCLAKLDKLRAGGDPAPLVERAIERGWQAFFPLDEGRHGKENDRDAERIRVLNGLTGSNPQNR